MAAVDDEDSEPAHRDLLRRLEKESSLTVPIVIEGTTWGELWVDYRSRARPRLTERDVPRSCARIADQIAAAIAAR